MKKKIISILLAFGMLASAIGTSAMAANVKKSVTETFVNEGFNGSFADTGFTPMGQWGSNDGYTTGNLAITNVDGSNSALKIITITGGDGTKVGFKYDIPTEILSSQYVMNISYRFNMTDTTGDFYASLYNNEVGLSGNSLQNINQDKNANIAFMSGGALKYGENYAYAAENPKSFANITAGEWYTVKSTVYVTGTSRISAQTQLLDKNNTVVGSHNRIVLSGGLVTPESFTVMANKTVYFDDLKIDFTYDKKFSSYDLDIDFSENNVLNQFGKFDYWDSNVAGVSVETVDGNQVLRLKNYETREIALAYYLPTALPDHYRMKVNYKMYMSNPEAGWFQLYAAGDNVPYRVGGIWTQAQKGTITADDNTQSAVPVNILNGNIGYFKAGTWYNDSIADLATARAGWYDISVTFDVTKGQRPTADVSIKNNGTAVVSYKAQIGGVNCKTINELQWWFRPSNVEQFVYIDDLNVEYSFAENTISSKQFVYFDGTKGALTASPESAVKGASFTLGEARNVTATLKSATDTVDVTVTKDETTPSIVTLTWNKELKNEEYELTLDYGAYEPFVYKFTPPTVELRAVSLEFYKGETKIENMSALSAGDEVTLKVAFENETGVAQKAVLVIAGYGNDAMKAAAYSPVDVETANGRVEKTFNFTVTKDMDEIRGFVWDSVVNMQPLAGSVGL